MLEMCGQSVLLTHQDRFSPKSAAFSGSLASLSPPEFFGTSSCEQRESIKRVRALNNFFAPLCLNQRCERSGQSGRKKPHPCWLSWPVGGEVWLDLTLRREKQTFYPPEWKAKNSNCIWSLQPPVCCGALWLLLHLPGLCGRVNHPDGASETSGPIALNKFKITLKPVKPGVPFLPVQRSLCGGGQDRSLLGTFGLLLFDTMNKEQIQIKFLLKGRSWNLVIHSFAVI